MSGNISPIDKYLMEGEPQFRDQDGESLALGGGVPSPATTQVR